MKFTPWIAAIVITLGVGAVAAPAFTAEADREDAEALSSREFAGQAMCGPNATAVWTDDKSLECLNHLP